jgi:hypothetical protein
MANLSSIVTGIQFVLQDKKYTSTYLIGQVNEAMNNIAAGIRMPDQQISPPLPDLYKYAVVNTDLTLPYVSLPSDYQRKVFKIIDQTLYQILPPEGGDYYSFARFLRQINRLDFSETGEVYRVAIKGSKLYYQGIPSAAYPLGVHYYRKPVPMSLEGDEPDGIPSELSHLQSSLLKHYVLRDIYGEMLEAGVTEPAAALKYHTQKFFEDMTDLVDYIGIDAEAQYYGSQSQEDRGVCD